MTPNQTKIADPINLELLGLLTLLQYKYGKQALMEVFNTLLNSTNPYGQINNIAVGYATHNKRKRLVWYKGMSYAMIAQHQIPQTDIANVLRVSQSHVCQAIKQFENIINKEPDKLKRDEKTLVADYFVVNQLVSPIIELIKT